MYLRVLLQRPLISSRAYGCEARRGPAGTFFLRRTGWLLGPRDPWRGLRASKVTRAGSISRDCHPPLAESRTQVGRWKTHAVSFETSDASSSFLLRQPCHWVQQQPHFELVPLLQLPAKLACACVCAVCLVILDLRNKRVATGFALGIPRTPRRTMETHNSYEFQKKPRSYSSKMHTVQLQRYNSSRA